MDNVDNFDNLGGDILDISNVPIPDEVEAVKVEDQLDSPSAFKFCFIGSGQGGGRIAHQFWQYGYRRVCAVNTAAADLEPLGANPPKNNNGELIYPVFPAENKLKIGSQDGAGGDVRVGAAATKESREDIFNLMNNSFGPDFDYIFIAASAGGGTGAGSCKELVAIASELIEKQELEDEKGRARIGIILSLPRESDGRDAHRSAVNVLNEIAELVPDKVSPLILIDNQKIHKLYPGKPAGKFWGQANHSACSIFHLLNVVSERKSEYTSFDRADYDSLLESGILAYGAVPITDWSNADSLSKAVRTNLTKNVLVDGVDISTGRIAGCVLVGNKDVLDNELPQEYIDDCFSMLSRMVKQGSPIRRGVYAGSTPSLVAYTLIGGLDKPDKKIDNLKKLAGVKDFDGA